ncbi:hypothetical protein [Pseudomonas fontis]|uniref:Uncharacterized protein n=1 Tax=Pseudomonas fontis TaxID=2942633 RepID=A0ABT5NUK6_9PSED|nr:hypothetical protein [Pseudomonas fontis]MDD0976947.1 hypothetical protein [Pseudomonas fontis]MDD0991842.1 hypothetical protein [Pseudomonas fontis]
MSNAEPKSPLTIIAIFAGIIEASALASLPFLGEDSQGIYTWFLVGFPPFLTLLFFLTLNFNSRSLYGYDPHEGDVYGVPEDSAPVREQLRPTLGYSPESSARDDRSGTQELSPSTITHSGSYARSLIGQLTKLIMANEIKPGHLILLDLDAGTETTISSRAVSTKK